MQKKYMVAALLFLNACTPVVAGRNLEQAVKYFSEGNFRKSASYAEKVLETEPDNIQAGILLADSFSERGNANKAINQYKDMIRRFPDNMDLVFRLGIVYNKAEYHKNAVDTYKQVLSKNPDHVLAHYRLGLSYALCMELSSAYSEYRVLKGMDAKLAGDLLRYIQTNN